MKPKNIEKFYRFLLFTVAVVWGFGFVFTKISLEYLSPSLLNILRFSTAAVIMFFIYRKQILKMSKADWLWGVAAGSLITAGFALQTYGITVTTTTKSALLTGMNIVMVPFFVWAVDKKTPRINSFIAAVVAFASMSLLTAGTASGFNLGDLLCLLCAVAFALHFVVLSRASKKVDAGALAFTQVFVPAAFFTVSGLAFDFESLQTATFSPRLILPLFSLSVLSTAYAYVVQTRSQAIVNPSTTSLIVSTEALFGAIFAVFLGYDAFSARLAFAVIGVTLSIFISEAKFNAEPKSVPLAFPSEPLTDDPPDSKKK